MQTENKKKARISMQELIKEYKIQLKTKSKKPASIYIWKNIWWTTTLRLSTKGRETGTNFWRVFYHQIEKNVITYWNLLNADF